MSENAPKGHGAATLAVLALLAAGGAGYYAWNLRGKHAHAAREATDGRAAYETCARDLQELTAQRQKLERDVQEHARQREAVQVARESSEKDLSVTMANLEATRAELEDLRKQRAETEKRLAAFRDLTARFSKMIDTGKLKVLIRDGRMIVKLPAEVLFDSGKAELSKNGERAIAEVAAILKGFPDRDFMIAGHTDNVPLRQSRYKSNWELSTARAVHVTQFLIGSGMKPKRLVAAGYGEHDPVGSNRSASGRRENRRIEIVLLPNLSELPRMPPELAKGNKGSKGSKGDKANEGNEGTEGTEGNEGKKKK